MNPHLVKVVVEILARLRVERQICGAQVARLEKSGFHGPTRDWSTEVIGTTQNCEIGEADFVRVARSDCRAACIYQRVSFPLMFPATSLRRTVMYEGDVGILQPGATSSVHSGNSPK